MTAPYLIEFLTKRYLEFVQKNQTVQQSSEVIEEEVKPKSIDHLKIIMKGQTLFKDIEPQIESSEYFLLMVNGQQGSGKTVAAKELAHYAHNAGYKLIYSSGFDMAKAQTEWVVQAAGAKKVCIVIDDTSHVLGSMSSKMQSTTKNWFGMIRHALQAQVFIILITHVSTGVPPILRNSNVWLYSNPTMSELDHMIKMVGRNEQARQKLQKTFDAVREIQEKAKQQKDIILKIGGRNYPFKWGTKSDPGDGRLMLLINNGEPMVYNPRSIECEACAYIGRNITMNPVNYIQSEKPIERGGMTTN